MYAFLLIISSHVSIWSDHHSFSFKPFRSNRLDFEFTVLSIRGELSRARRLMSGRWWEELDSDDDSDENSDEPSPLYAGTQLIELLLWLKMSNRLSAKYICIIAYWAFHSKGMGGLDKLGKKPNSLSGHFQRHLDGSGSRQRG